MKWLVTGAVGVGLSVALSACVTDPYAGAAYEQPRPLPPPPDTRVIFYPSQGQSAEQQDRDRYECFRWAVQQTGFDPSRPQVAPHERVAVVPAAPAGANTAAGAVTGAVVGAAVSNPRNAGGGALIGAIAGAMLGAGADASNQQQAERAQHAYDERASAQEERTAGAFRRAMGACLGGRGYVVQ